MDKKSVGRPKFSNQSGATAVEYALIAMLIAVSCIAAFTLVGGKVSTSMNSANAPLDDGIVPTKQEGVMGGS